MIDTDIAVVGAGPVGGTLACRLAAAGLRVAVIDRAALPPMEHPYFDGRAYAIAQGSRALLDAAGLWSALPIEPCPIHDIRVSDGRPGRLASRLHLHFDHRDAGAPFGWMVEARSLRVALNRRLHDLPSLSLHAPAEAVVHRQDDRAFVHLQDGTEISCALVVAAEGRESPLRRAARIPVTRLSYDQTGIVSAIAHGRPHHNRALEHFLPAGPFAQLPMGGHEDAAHVSAIVWTERNAVASRILALDDSGFGREIARRLGDHLGDVRPIGRRWHYPLSALHAHRYAATRLALVGDAAHGIHPIAGQGLNLGFRDAIALSDLLIGAARTGDDLGSALLLQRYQRQRRPDNLLMLGATDMLDRLFSTDRLLLRTMRDLGIAAVNRTPVLKQMFMRVATGGG